MFGSENEILNYEVTLSDEQGNILKKLNSYLNSNIVLQVADKNMGDMKMLHNFGKKEELHTLYHSMQTPKSEYEQKKNRIIFIE